MPTLNWIGKDKVINYHQQVPYRVLEPQYTYGQPDSGNLIIHGDNLDALKSLLPQYEGKVKLVYIDPPYNTGNENWAYNDNVNDPKIKKWLGEVVGKEGEDLSRHDKWLCMMYPRLKLLLRLLSDDGVIFVSLDDNEIIYLRAIMDEIFGNDGFVTQITLLCNPKGRSQDKYFATCHEYLLVYMKNVLPKNSFSIDKDESKIRKDYKLSDGNGAYRLLELRNTHREFGRGNRPNLWYPIFVSPKGNVSLEKTAECNEAVFPYWPDGYEGCWTWGKDLSQKDIHLLVGQQKNGEWKIYRKSYAISADGQTAKQKLFTIWNNPMFYTEKGQVVFGEIFPGTNKNDFPQPKSVDYIMQILRTITSENDIVLDSFAGSGTTAHAVLNLNKIDGGNRRFILVEMESYAESITAERVKRVIDGYGTAEGTGGGFTYCELGEQLLLDNGNLNEALDVEKICEYVWYTETRSEYILQEEQYLLGIRASTAYYFYYEKQCVTILDHDFLHRIKTKASTYVIYADINMLSAEEMDTLNIRFKKIPRDITRL